MALIGRFCVGGIKVDGWVVIIKIHVLFAILEGVFISLKRGKRGVIGRHRVPDIIMPRVAQKLSLF